MNRQSDSALGLHVVSDWVDKGLQGAAASWAGGEPGQWVLQQIPLHLLSERSLQRCLHRPSNVSSAVLFLAQPSIDLADFRIVQHIWPRELAFHERVADRKTLGTQLENRSPYLFAVLVDSLLLPVMEVCFISLRNAVIPCRVAPL